MCFAHHGRAFLKEGQILSQEGYLTAGNDRLLFVLVENRPADRSFVNMLYPCRPCATISKLCNMTFPMSRPG